MVSGVKEQMTEDRFFEFGSRNADVGNKQKSEIRNQKIDDCGQEKNA